MTITLSCDYCLFDTSPVSMPSTSPIAGQSAQLGKHSGNVRQQGFSLLEIAIVLVVIGLLAKTFLVPAGEYLESHQRKTTLETLVTVREAVTGFVVAHGRLPCPASLAGPAIERAECTSGDDWLGAVPAATLGLGGVRNSAGLMVDAWGRPIRYAVSTADHPEQGTQGVADFLVTFEMNNVGMRHLNADIDICSENTTNRCSTASLRANQVPAVFYSLGRDSTAVGPGAENQDGDKTFIRQVYSGRKEDGFDDLVLWISENILFYRLLQAGVLP